MFAVLLCCALFAEPSKDAEPSKAQLDLLKTFRAEFISITPGKGKFPRTFQMGNASGGPTESPVHEVTMSYDFAVGKYEVPQNLWLVIMEKNPSRWKGQRNSVEMLSFAEAEDFCRRTTRLMRFAKLIEADDVVRLPTEAEWEYVARAGTKTAYSFGSDAKEHVKFAWSTENAAGNDPPVGAKLPNPWGLHDVHGYLWEWCLDVWHPDYRGAPADGSAWLTGGDAGKGVARSGSWKDAPAKLTSSFRQSFPRDTRDDALGLRCVIAKSR